MGRSFSLLGEETLLPFVAAITRLTGRSFPSLCPAIPCISSEPGDEAVKR